MASSNKCEGCIFWEGTESTYRAKCKKLSDEAQTVTTSFDETCVQFFAKPAPSPTALVVPDLQSMTRGLLVSQELLDDCCFTLPSMINPNPGPNANGPLTLEAFQSAGRYFGAVRQTFVADDYGDLFDIDKYLREKISDEIMKEEDRQIMGYPVFHTSMGEGWPMGQSPITPVVFGDFSRYMEPLRITDFDVDFTVDMPQLYYPQGVSEFKSLWMPSQRPRSRIEGRAQIDLSSLGSPLSFDQPLVMKLVNRNGMEIDFRGRITEISMTPYGTEIAFVGDEGATMKYPVAAQTYLPLDDEDEDEDDDGESYGIDWGNEEEELGLDNLEDDLDDDEKDEDEGYGGNRRFYL
jgi:hypothetical protein